MSRKQQRRTERHIEHRRRQETALQEGGWQSDGSGRSLRQAMEAKDRVEQGAAHSGAAHLGHALCVLGMFVAVSLFWGSVAVSNYAAMALAGVSVVASGVWWWRQRAAIEKRTWAVGAASCVLVSLFGVVGVTTQTVVGNNVLRHNGSEEQSLRQIAMLRRDITRLEYWVDLSNLSDDNARVNVNEIALADAAAVLLAGASDEKWEKVEIAEAARRLRAASGYAHTALSSRYDTALQADPAKLVLRDEAVQAVLEQIASAGSLLDSVEQGVRGG
jgi:hypothetical protein